MEVLKKAICAIYMSNHTTISDEITRRNAILNGGRWLTAVVLGGVFYPLARFIDFKLPKKPVRIRVDKNLAIGAFHLGKEFILFYDEHGPWAVSRKCTHLGCSVSYNESEKKLVCPCHQSKFSVRGVRLAGPAKKNLKTFAAKKLQGDQKGFIVTV